MLDLLISAGAVVLLSALYGHAIWRACGLGRGSFAAHAVGFAALLVVAWLAVWLTASAVAGAAILGALALACAACLRRELVARPVLALGLPVTVVALGAVSLPFLVSGRVGLVGVSVNNDLSVHLLGAFWLQARHGYDVSKLLAAGYPMGPHALAAALSSGLGLSLERTFMGVIMAIPVLAALTALGVLQAGRAVARGALALLAGLCYLAAAYYAQTSFKEEIEALLLIGLAATLVEVARMHGRARARAAVALGVLAAGSVYSYSYLGPAWLAVALALWSVLEAARAPRDAVRQARAGAPAAATALVAFVVLAAPQVGRMIAFAASKYGNLPASGMANLPHPISPFEALGVWLEPDFRVTPTPFSATGGLALLALLVSLAAVVWALRRGERALVAALAGALAVYAGATLAGSPYESAKVLAIAAPLVTLVLGKAVLAGWRLAPRARAGPLALRAAALAVLLAGGASSLLALRDAPVGPDDHARELGALRLRVHGEPTLYLGNDDFASWELRGVPAFRQPAPPYPSRIVAFRTAKRWRRGRPDDFDSPGPGQLDRFAYAIAPHTPYQSRPPPNWRRVAVTRSYVLYSRRGPTPARSVLAGEHGRPGTRLDCSTPAGAVLSRRAGVAAVLPAPVLAAAGAWRGRQGAAGATATLSLRLAPGRWDVSLAYVSRQALTVRGPGMVARLPASLDRAGPYWLAGAVRARRAGPVQITVTGDRLPWAGRALHASGATFTARRRRAHALAGLAATRHGERERLVSLRAACGRYVDWYRLSGAAPLAASTASWSRTGSSGIARPR